MSVSVDLCFLCLCVLNLILDTDHCLDVENIDTSIVSFTPL